MSIYDIYASSESYQSGNFTKQQTNDIELKPGGGEKSHKHCVVGRGIGNLPNITTKAFDFHFFIFVFLRIILKNLFLYTIKYVVYTLKYYYHYIPFNKT